MYSSVMVPNNILYVVCISYLVLVLAANADIQAPTTPRHGRIESVYHGADQFEPQHDDGPSLTGGSYPSIPHGVVNFPTETEEQLKAGPRQDLNQGNIQNIDDEDDDDFNRMRTRRSIWKLGKFLFGRKHSNHAGHGAFGRKSQGLVSHTKQGRGLVGLIGHFASKLLGRRNHRLSSQSNHPDTEYNGNSMGNNHDNTRSYQQPIYGYYDGDDDDDDYVNNGISSVYRGHLRNTLKEVLDHFDFNTSPIFKRDYCYERFEIDLLKGIDRIKGFGVQSIHDFMAHTKGLKLFLTGLLKGDIVRPLAMEGYREIKIALMNALRRSNHGQLFEKVRSYVGGGYQDNNDRGYASPNTGYGAPNNGYGVPDDVYAAPDNGYIDRYTDRQMYVDKSISYQPDNQGFNAYGLDRGYEEHNSGYPPQNNGYAPQSNGHVDNNGHNIHSYGSPFDVYSDVKPSKRQTPRDLNQLTPEVFYDSSRGYPVTDNNGGYGDHDAHSTRGTGRMH